MQAVNEVDRKCPRSCQAMANSSRPEMSYQPTGAMAGSPTRIALRSATARSRDAVRVGL